MRRCVPLLDLTARRVLCERRWTTHRTSALAHVPILVVYLHILLVYFGLVSTLLFLRYFRPFTVLFLVDDRDRNWGAPKPMNLKIAAKSNKSEANSTVHSPVSDAHPFDCGRHGCLVKRRISWSTCDVWTGLCSRWWRAACSACGCVEVIILNISFYLVVI